VNQVTESGARSESHLQDSTTCACLSLTCIEDWLKGILRLFSTREEKSAGVKPDALEAASDRYNPNKTLFRGAALKEAQRAQKLGIPTRL
jgi:hypothetical protein